VFRLYRIMQLMKSQDDQLDNYLTEKVLGERITAQLCTKEDQRLARAI